MSGLQVTYTTLVVLVWLFAVATAWRSADAVVPENRVWTRAWRIMLACLAAGPQGWLIPFGAVYVIVRYGRVWRAPRHALRQQSAAAEPAEELEGTAQ